MLTGDTVSYFLGISGLIGIIFAVYNSFKNPQIKNDQDVIKLREDIESINKQVNEIKTSHLVTVEKNISELSKTIHDLALNVTRLSTIIDERMPRQNK